MLEGEAVVQGCKRPSQDGKPGGKSRGSLPVSDDIEELCQLQTDGT